MINRVLIRIKVVQLLYSYLLVENRFSIESQPDSPTREKRFAYNLYLDILYLYTLIAKKITVRGRGCPLAETRFIHQLTNDDLLRGLANKYSTGGYPFAQGVEQIVEKVKKSGLYKNFMKSKNPGQISDELIWKDIFSQIIMTDPQVNASMAEMENYTMKGVERMRGMMESTFSNFFAAGDPIPDAMKTLRHSMEKARELYFRLLELPVALTNMREAELEERRNLYLPTEEDRNPNLRFVENQLVEVLRKNDRIESYLEKHGAYWTVDDTPMLKSLLKAITASDLYREYMEFPATDFSNDCEFWRSIFKNVIFVNPDFLEALEDKSVFWNDDIDIIGTFVLKTLKRIAEMTEEPIFDMYKDEEDARFGGELFSYVVENKEEYRRQIDEVLDNSQWETERLAYMDVVVIMTAMAEILNFPKIPLKVSINEYIEIARSYSTLKSAQFVNGLLGGIITRLREEGRLMKA